MRWLRRLAARLVSGANAEFIRRDLEDLYAADRERGLSAARAHARFARRLLGSTLSLAMAWLRRPRLPAPSWIDITLAVRMLARHPGLTLVAGLALAIGIPVALAPMQMANAISARLPYPDRDRIVGLEHLVTPAMFDRQPTLHDFERWRDQPRSFAFVAAARPIRETVGSDTGPLEVRTGTEMTASAFDVPRVSPLRGRVLRASDEAPGAAPVVVIGYALWQSQFGGAADVLSRSLRIGRTDRAVVGVMPAEFHFPYRDDFWIPLQQRARDFAVGRGPQVAVFGRLRDGVSPRQAQAELERIDRAFGADHYEIYARLTPRVTELNYVVTGLEPAFDRLYPAYIISVLLLGVACANVGTLMLARTAGRSREIAVRAALGAGRGRIVMQLFTESLVLSTLAAAVGLSVVEIALRRLPVVQMFEATMPPWFRLNVTPRTILIAGCLAVFSALIAGLLPALRATRRQTYGLLQREGQGGGVRFGAMASALIIAEVAVAVAGLSGAASVARGAFRNPSLGDDIAASEYVTVQLRMTSDTTAPGRAALSSAELSQRLAAIEAELARRLRAEPGVRAVTAASHLPGMQHFRTHIEVESGAGPMPRPQGFLVRYALVQPTFFAALGHRPIVGRDFDARDLVERGRPVIVNRSFVEQVLGGRSPVGQRIRTRTEATDTHSDSWHPIIGVVGDLGMNVLDPSEAAGFYHVVAPGELHPTQLVVRVASDPSALVPRLRQLLTDVDPAIAIDNPMPLEDIFTEALWEARFSAFAFTAVATVAVILSAAGLYALMAFSVAQRTREIAIRNALGARPASVVRIVVVRAMIQLTVGVAVGAGVGAALVPSMLNDTTLAGNWRSMLAGVSIAMVSIGLLACAVPTRRALRIQPVAALKDL
jgi:predicted permease